MMSLPFERVNGETKGQGGIFLSGEVGTQKAEDMCISIKNLTLVFG